MAGELAAFKTTNVQFVPVAVSIVPAGSLFMDETSGDSLTSKTTGGTPQVIGYVQQMNVKQAILGGTVLDKRPIARRADGKIIAAGSDSVGAQAFIGYSMASGGDNDEISILLVGVNIEGAVTGLGFAPGDDVYLAEGGGYTNDPNSFSGGNDSIIKVGIADCAAGVASATATDLITFTDVLTRP